MNSRETKFVTKQIITLISTNKELKEDLISSYVEPNYEEDGKSRPQIDSYDIGEELSNDFDSLREDLQAFESPLCELGCSLLEKYFYGVDWEQVARYLIKQFKSERLANTTQKRRAVYR